MPELKWNQPGSREYHTGLSKGVLFPLGKNGVAWNGLISVKERPDTGTTTDYFLDGIKYLETQELDIFKATIEAFTYPDEFEESLGVYWEGEEGFYFDGQYRKPFSFAYRVEVGTDTIPHGKHYKIHLVYSATATPSDVSHKTISEDPELENFSWEISTVPQPVSGHRRGAHLVIDSRKVSKKNLEAVESAIYGTSNMPSRIPTPGLLTTLFKYGPTFEIIERKSTGLNPLVSLTHVSDLKKSKKDGYYSVTSATRLSGSSSTGLYKIG